MPHRVLHISMSDGGGGSGRSAYRVHVGLQQLGYQSHMLVGTKVTQDARVGAVRLRYLKKLDSLFELFTKKLDLQYMFYPSSFALLWHPWYRNADVVQLYNLHGDYFSFTALPLLSRNKTVVWRISDQWLFTGHCSYSYDCERWKIGCGACPNLSEYPSMKRDRTALLWKTKNWAYKHTRLHIVAPSSWSHRLAGESPLLNRFPTHLIPNGVDVNIFRPIRKQDARAALGLPQQGLYIIYYDNPSDASRKGSIYLGAISRELAKRTWDVQIKLLAIGGKMTGIENIEGLPVHSLGYVKDDAKLALVLSAADLFILTPLADNLPNSILESMACGTPVISWRVGGIGDAVRHLETGYLAEYQDLVDLIKGIELLIINEPLRLKLGAHARKMIEQEYTQELQAMRYADLYQEIDHGRNLE